MPARPVCWSIWPPVSGTYLLNFLIFSYGALPHIPLLIIYCVGVGFGWCLLVRACSFACCAQLRREGRAESWWAEEEGGRELMEKGGLTCLASSSPCWNAFICDGYAVSPRKWDVELSVDTPLLTSPRLPGLVPLLAFIACMVWATIGKVC
jgi:hypothetical protein